MPKMMDIIYTKVDEAPELASGSFLPIIQAFTAPAGISVGTKDISLAGRILAQFPEYLTADQFQSDDLNELGELVKTPEANVIKLPNISASISQLKAAITELQQKGYHIPDYPNHPKTQEEKDTQAKYDSVKGSAVNPVLREGNSDRRAPRAVKQYAKQNPHTMGKWVKESKTHVSSMSDNDFFSNEKSITVSSNQAGGAQIEFIDDVGVKTVLKRAIALQEGEIIDSTFMSIKALRSFLKNEIKDAKQTGLLFSLHIKATMMKVADPIIFGHAVSVFLGDFLTKHKGTLSELGFEPNNGFGELESKIASLPVHKRDVVAKDLEHALNVGPQLYMVNSDKGITNLHVSSDVIIDASMPALIRAGGKAWGPDGKEHDTKCVIPDNSYADVYEETINFCKEYGAFKPSEMGTIPNVGLMAQKAEEYGSHPQTFKMINDGSMRVVAENGDVILEHRVEKGDIWRMCMTKDEPIRNWVKLAISRAQATGVPVIFWLNEKRAHDSELIKKVERYLNNEDVGNLDIQTMAPRKATRFSLERMKNGLDTISATGNVLRDYLTDLFPILELGTSAKMLSIVPLMNGGGLFETGAGGSAPKHVQQLLSEGHLRWDSLGEFCALAASLEHLSNVKNNSKAQVLADTLDKAISGLLIEGQSPGRKVGELDNRGSHFYLAKYWAAALCDQQDDIELKTFFESLLEKLELNENKILSELRDAQGSAVDIGGYYKPEEAMRIAAMRPSPTLNAILS